MSDMGLSPSPLMASLTNAAQQMSPRIYPVGDMSQMLSDQAQMDANAPPPSPHIYALGQEAQMAADQKAADAKAPPPPPALSVVPPGGSPTSTQTPGANPNPFLSPLGGGPGQPATQQPGATGSAIFT